LEARGGGMSTFAEFAHGIKFRYAQPMDPTPTLEMANVELPEGVDMADAKRIYSLSLLTKLSSFAIGMLLNKAVREMPVDQCYVNIGFWHGFSLFSGMLGNPDKTCIGVDNFSEFGDPRAEFLNNFARLKSEKHFSREMDYEDFFSRLADDSIPEFTGKIGVYFYDAKHEYEHQLKGLKLVEPFLADGALVFVDDWNWEEPQRATCDFILSSPFEWEQVLDAHTYGVGNPTWWNGLAVFKKGALKPVA
jgi:hypothetical protein